MAVGRQLNIKGQWRVDVPHLRMIESSVANDFDTLAGVMLAGKQPYIVNGFTILNAAINLPATDLVLAVAGATAIHYYASENGSILLVPASRPPETLNVTNSRVVGAFASNSTNYVGIDFRRSENSDTSDVVQFLDPSTQSEAPKTVPLARTLDYRIIIQTVPFSGTTNVCPIAIVTTDGSNRVADNGSGGPAVRDARSMYFRLAAGGDSPLPENPYSWPDGRAPESIYSFAGGDKAITHERDWKRAVMTRLWEVTGGQYWYSDTTMQNLRVCYGPAIAPLGDNVEFNSGTGVIKWTDISILFATNTGDVTTPIYNTVTNNTTGIVLADNYGLYVDVDRFNNGAVLTAATAPLYNLGSPTHPGSRTVIAYRRGNNVYLRDRQYEVGRAFPPATTTTLGGVYTNTAPADPTHPYAVVSDGLGGTAIAAGLTRGGIGSGTLTIAGGANDDMLSVGVGGFAGHHPRVFINCNSGSFTPFTVMSFLAPGSVLADAVINSWEIRTAGSLFQVNNQSSTLLDLDYQGKLKVLRTVELPGIYTDLPDLVFGRSGSPARPLNQSGWVWFDNEGGQGLHESDTGGVRQVGAIIYPILDADWSNNTTTYQDAFRFLVADDWIYQFEAEIQGTTTGGSGARFTFSKSGGYTSYVLGAGVSGVNNAGATVTSNVTTLLTDYVLWSTNDTFHVRISGLFVVTGSGSNTDLVRLMVKNGGAGTTTIHKGSYLKVRRFIRDSFIIP